MKTWMMIKSSIKKNRSSSITLVLLIVLATMFLNIGINAVMSMSSFVDDKNKSLNGADFIAYGPIQCRDDAVELIRNTEGYQALEDEKALVYTGASFCDPAVEKKPQSIDVMLLDINQKRDISQLKLIDEQAEMKENSIVLPYSLKTGFDYQAGDEVEITYAGQKNTYEIYAFSEDIMFPNAMAISCYKCFLPTKTFQDTYQQAEEKAKFTYIRVQLTKGYDSKKFDKDFTNKAEEVETSDVAGMVSLNYNLMKTSSIITATILMMILVTFAILIIVIAMVIIRFTIVSHIEQDMKNIGSMEAIGFTGSMIQRSLLGQYLFIMMVGYAVGDIIAYICSGYVSGFIASTMGLNWNQRISCVAMLITFTVLCVLISTVTLNVSKRIRKVTPIMAVRNGVETFHFEKNHLPLDSTYGNLHVLLGIKQLIHNKKQNLWIGLIGFLMSASMVFALAMYNNFVARQSVLLNLIGQEKANVSVEYKEKDYQQFYDWLANKPGVEKTSRFEVRNATVCYQEKTSSTLLRISDDFKKNEIDVLVEGRMPEHDNEMAISYATNEDLGVCLGDVVQLMVGKEKFEFVVVGFTQHIAYMGLSVSITEAGMLRCNPEFIPNTLLIYLDSEYKTADFIDTISDEAVEQGGVITNVEESFSTMLATLNRGITLLCIIVVIITLIIVILILYYLVKEKLIKEKLQLGIQKALGFTTGQLVFYMNLEFSPVILLSSVAGGILSVMLINPTCNLMLSIADVKKCSMTTNPMMIVIAVVILLTVSVLVTTLVSLRIRKIEPRDLFLD